VVEFCAAQDAAPNKTGLASYLLGRRGVVPGDHDDLNSGALALGYRLLDFRAQRISQSHQAQPVELSTAHLQVQYANLCRGMMGAEEIVLDFGFNPNSAGKVTDEPAQLTSRIILTVPSAVRLYQLLHALLAKRQEVVQQAQASAAEANPESTDPPA
jgi:hypothetical protein